MTKSSCEECEKRLPTEAALCRSCGQFAVGGKWAGRDRNSLTTFGLVMAVVFGGIGSFWVLILIVCAVVAVDEAPYQRMIHAAKAQSEAQAFAKTAKGWSDRHGGTCPTFRDLRWAGEVSPFESTSDPWNRPYRIACTSKDTEVDIEVWSDGPDRITNSADDDSWTSS